MHDEVVDIAYIVSAYKNPAQLVRLVHRLSAPNTHVLVHVDRRTPAPLYRAMAEPLRALDRVLLLERHACRWGDFGHVRATLKGIAALIEQGLPFDFVILLTGQDYPIKSQRDIARTLAQHRDRSFMEYFPLPTPKWMHGGLDRIEHWHLHVLGLHLVFPGEHILSRSAIGLGGHYLDRLVRLRRKFPAGFRPFGGSSYWCLNRACIAYVYQFVRQQPPFVRFFEHVFIPDESFFQTIILNSPLRQVVVNDNLRYIVWSDEATRSPAILRGADVARMLASPALFARKFDATRDTAVLDRIDAALAQRE